MKRKILLFTAASLMFLHTIGHTFGALSWKQAPDESIHGVITSMQTHHFIFMGRSVSLAGFYEGYGVSMIFVLLLISFLLLLLALEKPSVFTARLQWLLAAFLITLSVIEYIYFFPFAAAFSLLAGACSVPAVRSS